MKWLTKCLTTFSASAMMAIAMPHAEACTRVLYETGTGTYITGRSMDWNDLHMQTDFWVFPRGMKRDGGVGPSSITWTSKYGSVIISAYDLATSDGVNEAGMAGNLLYLAESDFGNPAARGKPTIRGRVAPVLARQLRNRCGDGRGHAVRSLHGGYRECSQREGSLRAHLDLRSHR
jgi:penicillin V acylase-like amidase (Ntn superfamily)